MQDDRLLIAILEFELAACQAREAMIRERAMAVIEAAQLPPGPAARTDGGNPRVTSGSVARVPKRALIALRSHLARPVDHGVLIERLHQTRYGALKALSGFGILPPGRVGELCAAVESATGGQPCTTPSGAAS